MQKVKEAWQLFTQTGKVEHYSQYRRLLEQSNQTQWKKKDKQ